MWRIIARHMAAAVTARGRTAVGEHKALNAQITRLPTDFAELELNLFFFLFFYTDNLFMGIKELV